MNEVVVESVVVGSVVVVRSVVAVVVVVVRSVVAVVVVVVRSFVVVVVVDVVVVEVVVESRKKREIDDFPLKKWTRWNINLHLRSSRIHLEIPENCNRHSSHHWSIGTKYSLS